MTLTPEEDAAVASLTAPVQKRIIFRYSNRKLYDTAAHRYLSFEQLLGMVQDHEPFEVRESKNREDITIKVLAGMFAQMARRGIVTDIERLKTFLRESQEAHDARVDAPSEVVS